MGAASSAPAAAGRGSDWGNENVVPNCRQLNESASEAVWEARRCSDGRRSLHAHPLYGGEDLEGSPCAGWPSRECSPGRVHNGGGCGDGRHPRGVQRRLDMDRVVQPAAAAPRHLAASCRPPVADRSDAALRDVASEGYHGNLHHGAFADGTAMVAAAAGGGFFSPLSVALLAPQQQRRLATPDLSPRARRRQLEQEQQASPWQPLAPLGREHSRSPARAPCSDGGSGPRDCSPLRPPCSERGRRQQRSPDRQLSSGGGQQPTRDEQQQRLPPDLPDHRHHRSDGQRQRHNEDYRPHQRPSQVQRRHPDADDAPLHLQHRQAPRPQAPARHQQAPNTGEHPRLRQQQPPQAERQQRQTQAPAWQRAAQQQQRAARHQRQQQRPDLGRASTDTVVLADRAAALGIHPLPTPPCSPRASPPDPPPAHGGGGGGGGRQGAHGSRLGDADAPPCQQAGRRPQHPGWPGRCGRAAPPTADVAAGPPPTRPRSDPDLRSEAVAVSTRRQPQPGCARQHTARDAAQPSAPHKEGYEPHYGAGSAAAAPESHGSRKNGSGSGGSSGGSVPAHFICPITHQLMFDPVVAADGFCFEASAISRWLETHDTSPLTNERLPHKGLIRNHTLRSAIMDLQRRGA